MSIIYGQPLVSGFDIPNTSASDQKLYLVGSELTGAVITYAIVTNHTGSSRVVTLWVLMGGESQADRRKIWITETVAPKKTVLVKELVGRALDQGGKVEGECDESGAVSISLTGNELTL